MNTEKVEYVGNTAVGLIGGTASYVWCPRLIGRAYVNFFSKQSKKITSQEQDEFWKSAEQALVNSNLQKKSIKLVDINENNWEPIADDIVRRRRNALNKSDLLTKILAKFGKSDAQLKEHIHLYAKGQNSGVFLGSKQILVNKEKNAVTSFHEMGHVVNAAGQGFKRSLSSLRGRAALLAPLIFGISMITPKDREDSPTKNPIYKSLLFVKKYAGILVSTAMLPLVAEEGLASINGAKLGKKVLSKELYKKMNNMNLKAFMSYILAMILAGAGTTLANYIKDKVTGPLPSKNSQSEIKIQTEKA